MTRAISSESVILGCINVGRLLELGAALFFFGLLFSSGCLLFPPAPPKSSLSPGGGNCSDSNISIWNGISLVPFNLSNNLTFTCDSSQTPPVYCAARRQDASTGRYVLLNTNNGTSTSVYQAICVNTTFTGATIVCGTSTNPASAKNLTLCPTFVNYSTTNLTVNSSNALYCWLNVTNWTISPLSGWSVNITNGC